MRKLSVSLFFIIFCLVFVALGLTAETKQVIANSYSATIAWNTDKPSTSQVEYDASKKYGYTNITELDQDLVTSHKVTLRNLQPATMYHYRIRSKDAFGNEAISPDYTFVTLKEPPKDQPPQISDVEAKLIVAAGPAEKAAVSSSELATQEAGQMVKKEAPIEKALIEKGGLLLGRGKWQVEPSFAYAHVSANRIAFLGYTIIPVLVVGQISSEEVKRDIFIETLTTRYGLKDNLQLELKVPYRYQHDRVSVGTTSETTRHLAGLGDIEGGIYHQFASEKGMVPDLIAGLSVKSRTGKEPYGRDIGLGTGHWAVKGSLVAVKSSDPAIIFGGLGYTYNIKRNNIPGYGTIEPGATFNYNLGVAFALNYQLALSLQLEELVTTSMRMNDSPVPSSFTNVVNFKYGATWSISKDFSCDITATHGLSSDAPNFALEIRFPYTF